METLPPEILHYIVFSFATPASTVLSLSLTSHHFHTAILGPVLSPNAYDVDQFRAKGGIGLCIANGWVRAACMALARGYGDPSADNNAPLLYAVRNNHTKLTELLLEDPRVTPSRPALVLAIQQGHLEVAKLLLTHLIDADSVCLEPHDVDNEIFRLAVSFCHTPLVRHLLTHSPDIDPGRNNNFAIGEAAKNNDTATTSLLLADPRVDPGGDNNYALREAAKEGHTDVLALLLADPRVDPGANHNEALFTATCGGQTDVANLLLDHLPLAPPSRARIDIVSLLLANPDFDPGLDSNYGLRYASDCGYADIVALLLADPRVNPAEGHSQAIACAASSGHLDVLLLLLADGRIDPSANDNAALRFAVRNNHTAIATLLLADPRVSHTH